MFRQTKGQLASQEGHSLVGVSAHIHPPTPCSSPEVMCGDKNTEGLRESQ